MRNTAEGLVVSLGIGIPLVLWDVFWLLDFSSREARQASFMNLYGLEVANILFGEPPVLTDVVRATDGSFWVGVALFILTPAAACLEGCTLCVPYPCT